MTDIEQKALALVREVLNERNLSDKRAVRREVSPYTEALCRAIERHEAFRQVVCDAIVSEYLYAEYASERLQAFIIPKPKPDPLVEALVATDGLEYEPQAQAIRAALKACGFEIRSKNDG
jgi:hypothetical protein